MSRSLTLNDMIADLGKKASHVAEKSQVDKLAEELSLDAVDLSDEHIAKVSSELLKLSFEGGDNTEVSEDYILNPYEELAKWAMMTQLLVDKYNSAVSK